MRCLAAWRNKNAEAGELEEGAEISRILQKVVVKHYYLCRRDCLRQSPTGYRRYVWRVNGGETQAVIQASPGTEAVSVPGIVPDQYSLSLSTGRLIWEGTILPEQVLWAEACPGRDLKIAAQTGDLEQEATHVESLLNGELELRLYPGLEAGTMRIARPDTRLGTRKEA